MAKARRNADKHRSPTAAGITAERRPVTKADLQAKLREIGAENDAEVVEGAIGEEVVEEAEAIAARELGPVGILLSHTPKLELAIAVGFAAVIVVYKLGELVGRPRGPQIEVRPLRFPASNG